MKTKILTMIFMIGTMISLCACGNKKEEASTPVSQEERASQSIVEEPEEKREYTLSEYLSEGESVWLKVNGTGKDAKVQSIYVFEPDGTLYFTKESVGTLGEVEQMEDADIIKMVKEDLFVNEIDMEIENLKGNSSVFPFINDAECFIGDGYMWVCAYLSESEESPYREICKELMDKLIEVVQSFDGWRDVLWNKEIPEQGDEAYYEKWSENLDDYMWHGDEAYLPAVEPIIEDSYKKAEAVFESVYADTYKSEAEKCSSTPISYNLVITTDATGNYTSEETVAFMDNILVPVKDHNGEIIFGCEPYLLTLSEISYDNIIEIYDSLYSGYYCKNSYFDSYFITRVNKQCTFRLDEVGTEGISLDNVQDYNERKEILTLEYVFY